MDHKLDCGILGGIFAVPNAVVDNFIKLASGEAVKVLLYMLRHSGQSLSSKDIASALNIREEQVEEAFVFWENANIFSSSVPAETVPEPKGPEPVAVKPVETPKKAAVPDRSNYNISPSEIAARIEGSEEIKGFFFTAESIFGAPLNHTQQRSFIYLLDYLGISAEVLLMVIAYSVKTGKKAVNYIEQVAYDFNERGITTLELAQKEIKQLEDRYTYTGRISRIFDLQRRPTKQQQEYIDIWQEKGYSFELIEYACEDAVNKGKGINFPYVNGMLSNWEKAGITTVEQAMGEKKQYEKSTGDSSFNINDLIPLANNFGDI